MIKDLKELEKLLKICRKQGVTDISIEGISIKLGDHPIKSSSHQEEGEIENNEPTEDELIYYAIQNAGPNA